MLDRKEIGFRLRRLRWAKDVSSAVVSERLGISRSALQMYEAGKRLPKDDIKVLLAEFYGMSVEDLFFSPDMSRNETLSRSVVKKEVS